MPTYNNGVVSGGTLGTAGNTAVAAATWNSAKTAYTTPGTYGGDMVQRVIKTQTYTAGAGTGNVGSVVLFTITGQVQIVGLSAFTVTDLTESGATATIALGVVGSTSLFVAATNAVDLDAGEFWIDTSPDLAGIALPAGNKDIIINANIVNTIAVTNVTAGVVRYVVYYVPLSSGSGLV